MICNLRENPIYILCRMSHNWLNNHAIRIKYKIFSSLLRVAMAALYRALEAKWAYIGKYFMLLLSIYVLYSNVSCIYPLSCLVEIKITTKRNIASKLVIEQSPEIIIWVNILIKSSKILLIVILSSVQIMFGMEYIIINIVFINFKHVWNPSWKKCSLNGHYWCIIKNMDINRCNTS